MLRTKFIYLLAMLVGLSLVIIDSNLNDRNYLGDIIGYLLALYAGFLGSSFFHKRVKPRRENSN